MEFLCMTKMKWIIGDTLTEDIQCFVLFFKYIGQLDKCRGMTLYVICPPQWVAWGYASLTSSFFKWLIVIFVDNY